MTNGKKTLSTGEVVVWTIYSENNACLSLNGTSIVWHEDADLVRTVLANLE